MNERGFVNIVVIVLVVILAGATGYFVLRQRIDNLPAPDQTQPEGKNDVSPIQQTPAQIPSRITPSPQPNTNQGAPSVIKVISPNGGEKLIRGVIHKIRWSIVSAPISKEVDIEIFKTGTCGAGQSCSLSSIANHVSGGTYDWVAGSDSYGNRLNYSSYMIVIRPSSDRSVKSDTSDAGFSFIDQVLFSIDEIYGLKSAYKPGEKISISIRGVESDGTPTSQEEGFGAQIALNNGQNSQIVNGIYDTASGLWKAEITAPLNSGTYNFGYGLYCSPDKTYCKRYSIEGQGQVFKELKITVAP